MRRVAVGLMVMLASLYVLGCGEEPAAVSPNDLGKTEEDVTGVEPETGGEDVEPSIPKLKVLSVSPNSGSVDGGYLVVVNGAGFTNGARVFFGEVEAADVLVQSLHLITCQVPPGPAGKADIKVLRLDGEADILEGAFTYKEAGTVGQLLLSGITPGSGPETGGFLCLLSGEGFAAGLTVRLGPYVPDSVNVLSPTSATFVAPAGLPGKVDVIGKLGDQTAILEGAFEYLASEEKKPLTLAGVYPSSGDLGGGFLAVITGTGFEEGLQITFGQEAASVVDVPSSTSLTVVVPATAKAGKVDVAATMGEQTAILTGGFEYLDKGQEIPLTLLSVQPSSGFASGGYPAVVIGTGFKPGITLLMGDVAVSFVNVVSGDVLTFIVPPHDPGLVSLKALQGGDTVTLEGAFAYIAEDELSVTGVDPAAGPIAGGTVCLVKGNAFADDTTVFFGAGAALVKDVVSSQALLVETPPSAVGGLVDVVVKDSKGNSAALEGGFEYVETVTLALAKVQPSTGDLAGGYLAMLTGAGFEDGMTATFGDLPAEEVNILSPSAAVAEVPAAELPGLVDVAVENMDGASAILPEGFLYTEKAEITDDPPQIGLIKPKKGPVQGGTWVLITGSNLAPSATVEFETTPAAQVAWFDPTMLLALTPPMAPGYADVRITNPDKQYSTLANGFLFQVPAGNAPAIDKVVPSSGPSTGGTLVAVDGQDFQPGILAFLGYQPVLALNTLSAQKLTFEAPPGEPGPADLVLVNPDGQTAILAEAFAYYDLLPGLPEPPIPTAVFPEYGSAKGGETVTITGTGFEQDSMVYFGGEPVEVLLVVGTSQIKVKTIAHAAGSVDVAVVNSDGQTGSIEGGFVYLVDPPFISALLPDHGLVAGGNGVAILGKNIAGGAKVMWDGALVGGLIVTPPDKITLIAPPHAAGAISVTVVNPDGLSDTKAEAYTYEEPQAAKSPEVSKVSPSHGIAAGGYEVVITGDWFDPLATVKFGTKPSSKVQVLSTQAIVAKAPPGPAGDSVTVTVTNPDGLFGELADGFAYDTEEQTPLALLSVTPASGPAAGGTPVTLVGSGFVSQGLKVMFGGQEAAAATFVSEQVISAVTPKAAPGLVDVKVSAGGQETVLAGAFLFQKEAQVNPPPTALSVVPPTGPAFGGTLVEVHGKNFVDGAQVMFGGVMCDDVVWSSAELLLAPTPSHDPGTVSVVIFNPDGQSSILGSGFTYYDDTAAQPPIVLSVLPTYGSALGGETVTLAGQNLAQGMTVFFCGLPALDVAVFGSTQVTAKTPAAPVGVCDVTVVNPDGLSAVLKDAFTFQAPKPVLDQVVPAQGDVKGGTAVVLHGKNFMEGMEVWFANSKGTGATVFDSTTASVTTPPGLPGAVDVKVVNPGGQQGVLPGAFTYKTDAQVLPPPQLTSIVPASGPVAGGTVVKVSGANFQDGIIVIFGDNKAAQVTFSSASSLLVTTPAGKEGPVDVTLLNPDGQGLTAPGAFVYVVPTKPAPQIFGVVPSSGPEKGGTTILVTGKNFTSKGMLYVGLQPVGQFTYLNASVVSGTTPAGKPGPVSVSYVADDGQEATLANGYTYIPAPQIASLSPELGPKAGGTDVTIVGQNFQPGLTAFFGKFEAQSVTVENSLIVHAVSPAGAVAEAVDVKLINPDGQSGVLAKSFTYLLPPKVTSATPSSGPVTGGTPVAISGAAFFKGAKVLFGDAEAGNVQVVNDALILCNSPASADPVAVAITVVNPDAQKGSLPDAFLYLPEGGVPPVLTGISPASGPEGGATLVTLTGTNLGTPDSLLMGQTPVTDFVSASDTEVVFETPVHAPGVVDIVYVNDAGLSAVLPKSFTFIATGQLDPAPKILSLDPTSGPTTGGTTVALAGTGFKNNATVFFGTAKAAQVVFLNPGSVTAVTPPQGAGLVDVSILNADGQVGVLASAYTFVPAPTVAAVNPANGASEGGTVLTVDGAGFWDGNVPAKRSKVVLCDDFAAQKGCVTIGEPLITKLTTKQVVFATPAHAPGFVDVGIINPDGQKGFLGKAYYFNEPPIVTKVSPSSGSTVGGQSVGISGTGFQVGVEVYFGSKAAVKVTIDSPSKLTVTTPPGNHGPVDVIVLNPDGSEAIVDNGYSYISPPIISKVYPLSGPEDGGTQVTIEGNYFWTGAEISRVRFGTALVPVADTSVVSNKVIIVKSPPGKGPVAITVTNPDEQFAQMADAFVYVPPAPPPTITFVIPNSGLATGGYPVSVIGTGFQDGAQVYFGKPGAWSLGANPQVKNLGTMITVLAPNHAAGKVDVKVVNTNQQEAVEPDSFEFTPAPQLPPLAFASVTPNRSPVAGGVTVTVSGKGFKPGILVYVGTAPNWTVADKTDFLGPTLAKVIVPPSPTGVAGTFDLLLLNPSAPGNPDQVIAKGVFSYTKGGVFIRRGMRLPPDGRDDNCADLVDLNNDGLRDVVVCPTNGGGKRSQVFLNTEDEVDGPGEFVFQGELTNWNSQDSRLAYGDFDGDGDIDIIQKRSDRMSLEYSYGDGTFTGANDRGWISYEANYLTPADFDCDGYLDVFVAVDSVAGDRPNRILTNDGYSNFDNHSTNVLPAHYEYSRMGAAADVDLDGDVDLVIGNRVAMQKRLYYNNCANIPSPPQCARPLCTKQVYGGHTYAVCEDGRTWENARRRCEHFGYYMAVINDKAEHDFLQSKTTGGEYWIGYNDIAEEKSWKWQNNSPSTYTKWCGGQPDNSGGNEDCAAFRFGGQDCWGDRDCNGGYRFICEADVAVCPDWKFTDAQYGPGNNFPIAGFDTQWVTLVDLDGNMYPDAVVGNWGQPTRVYMNYGGNFQNDDLAHFPQNEGTIQVYKMFAVDIDLDGDVDLLQQVAEGGWVWIRVYKNDLKQGGSGALVYDASAVPARKSETSEISVGDVTGDSLPDIYVVNRNHQDQLLINNGFAEGKDWIDANRVGIGKFAFNTVKGYPEAFADSRNVRAADLDGDGADDLVVIGWGWNRVRTLMNDGAGNFADESSARMPVTPWLIYSDGESLEIADLDSDGDIDVVVAGYEDEYWNNGAAQIREFLNNGNGFFKEATDGNVPSTKDQAFRGLAVADFNKDGKPDIVATGFSNWTWARYYRVFINGGDPFDTGDVYFFDQTAKYWGSLAYDGSAPIAAADFNYDGFIDLYHGRGWGGYQNRVLLNEGGKKFIDVTDTYLPSVSDDTKHVYIGDLDVDGDLDLLSTNWGQSRIYLQEKDFKFADATTSNMPTESLQSLASCIADYDGDTLPDIYKVNYEQKKSLYLNTGAGKFESKPNNLPWDADYSRGCAASDFDGDGDIDVYVVNIGLDAYYENTN